MSLYLFNKAHTGTTTSDLKSLKNIMVTKVLYYYSNVTKHRMQHKSMETCQPPVETMHKFGQQLFIKKSILMYELISFQSSTYGYNHI